MAEEEKHHGFIIEKTDADNESLADLPKNRSMLIEKLTFEDPPTPEIKYGMSTIDEVFDNYKPTYETDVKDLDGNEGTQKFEFKGLGDFSPKGLTEQSDTLKGLKSQKDDYLDIARKLQSNKVLQKVLNNPEAKEDFVNAMKAMLDELG